MDSVFVLQHIHTLSSGEGDIKCIGAYSSEELARNAVGRLGSQPAFRDYPTVVDQDAGEVEGFHIDKYVIDSDGWSQGYVTV